MWSNEPEVSSTPIGEHDFLIESGEGVAREMRLVLDGLRRPFNAT
jgi:hypothetical protein